MNKGVFVLSLDTELAWGCCSNKKKISHNKRYYLETRSCITSLLQLLEKYDIAATWAVVGHLFLSKCKPINGVKHPEIIRPQYRWLQTDWFSYDPCSSLENEPLWYGKDIIEMIKNCKKEQEIGCHTFSHIVVGDPGCSRACFNSELELCRNLAEESGINLKSFVFPRNKEKFIDSLNNNGFIAYRGIEKQWYNKYPGIVQKLGYLCDSLMFFIPPPVGNPKKNNCWNINGSWFYAHCDGIAKILPISCGVNKIKNGVNKAIERGEVFHLWFHPFNLASNPQGLLNGLDNIFSYVNRLVREGKLENLTMGGLANRLELKNTYEISHIGKRISLYYISY